MNVCIVSTFEGTTEDYMEMFNATEYGRDTIDLIKISDNEYIIDF